MPFKCTNFGISKRVTLYPHQLLLLPLILLLTLFIYLAYENSQWPRSLSSVTKQQQKSDADHGGGVASPLMERCAGFSLIML